MARKGLSENRQLNWDLGDKKWPAIKNISGKSIPGRSDSWGKGPEAGQVNRLNTSVTEAEWTRERAEEKKSERVRTWQVMWWAAACRNSASNHYHHKAKKEKERWRVWGDTVQYHLRNLDLTNWAQGCHCKVWMLCWKWGLKKTILRAECRVGIFIYHYIAGSWNFSQVLCYSHCFLNECEDRCSVGHRVCLESISSPI